MVIDMSEQKLVTLAQVRRFLEGTAEVEFRGCGKDEDRYWHIEGVLRRFGYSALPRADKGLVMRYLMCTTGYSRQQLTRLIKRALAGPLRKAYRAPTQGFARRFTDADLALLAQTDSLHGTLSGPATRHLMLRALSTYGDDLDGAPVQPEEACRLRRAASAMDQDTSHAGAHRRAPGTGAGRTPRLYPHRQCASGRPRRREGRLSHQCR